MKSPMIKPSRKGLLHKKLGVPQGKPIPKKKLAAAKKRAKKTKNAALMKEVTFAQNFGKSKGSSKWKATNRPSY
jgi:hypothetical protein